MSGVYEGQGGQPRIKPRRPAAVALFSILTLGIYVAVWYYKVNREMRDFGSIHDDRELAASKPWWSVAAVTVGAIVVVPELVSLVRTVGRLDSVERIAGGAARPAFALKAAACTGALLGLGYYVRGIGALFLLAGAATYIAVICVIQARLNAAWRSAGVIASERAGDAIAA